MPSDTAERRGTKRPIELSGHESGSTASNSTTKKSKARNVKPKEDQQSMEAQNYCRRSILSWFAKHSMVHLEKQYLSDGLKGLELVRGKLKLLLLDGMAGDEFLEDRKKSDGLKNKSRKPSSIQ